jgi:hypothetical protein
MILLFSGFFRGIGRLVGLQRNLSMISAASDTFATKDQCKNAYKK